MNDKSQKSESFIEMLLYAVDCIRYTEQISALHDCNDCEDTELVEKRLKEIGKEVTE